MLEGKQPQIFGSGDQERDFLYVGDVVEANILAIDRGDGQTFNVGTGQSTSINRLFSLLRDILQYRWDAYHLATTRRGVPNQPGMQQGRPRPKVVSQRRPRIRIAPDRRAFPQVATNPRLDRVGGLMFPGSGDNTSGCLGLVHTSGPCPIAYQGHRPRQSSLGPLRPSETPSRRSRLRRRWGMPGSAGERALWDLPYIDHDRARRRERASKSIMTLGTALATVTV